MRYRTAANSRPWAVTLNAISCRCFRNVARMPFSLSHLYEGKISAARIDSLKLKACGAARQIFTLKLFMISPEQKGPALRPAPTHQP